LYIPGVRKEELYPIGKKKQKVERKNGTKEELRGREVHGDVNFLSDIRKNPLKRRQ